MTILLVEQNFRFAAELADRFYVMEDGQMVDAFRRRPSSSARMGYAARACWGCERRHDDDLRHPAAGAATGSC